MLDEVVKIAEQRAVDAVVFAGDIFHLKAPSRTSHRTVQRMISVGQSFSCPVYLVAGNHDLSSDRIDSIPSQPFGVLLKSGFNFLTGWDARLPIYGVSWQQHWDGDYSEAFLRWLTEVDTRWDGNALLVTHAPIYPPGFELPWENVPAADISLIMGKVGFCYYGHVHDWHGAFEVDGVVFCNQGALSRGSLHESDIKRRPAVTIWHSETTGVGAFERVELVSAPPADQVFRLAAAAEREDYANRLNAFLASMTGAAVEVTSIETVLAQVQSMGLSAAEVSLAEEVLTNAAHGDNK